MKHLMDIIVLSIAFWVGGIKLLLALHQPSAEESVRPSLDMQDRPDPEVQAAEKQAKEAQEKAALIQVEKDTAEKKAKTEADQLRNEVIAKNAEVAEKAAEASKAKENAAKLEKEKADLLKKQEKPEKPIEPAVKQEEKEARHWTSDLESAKRLSFRTNIPVYATFEGPDCIFCEGIKKYLYETKQVSPILRREYIPVWLYSNDYDDNHRNEFQQGVPRFPFAVVIQPDGKWKTFVPRIDTEKTRQENIDDFLEELKKAST